MPFPPERVKKLMGRKHLRLPLMRELSAKLTEGEKSFVICFFNRNQYFGDFSPPVTACAVPAPSSEGANSPNQTFLRV